MKKIKAVRLFVWPKLSLGQKRIIPVAVYYGTSLADKEKSELFESRVRTRERLFWSLS